MTVHYKDQGNTGTKAGLKQKTAVAMNNYFPVCTYSEILDIDSYVNSEESGKEPGCIVMCYLDGTQQGAATQAYVDNNLKYAMLVSQGREAGSKWLVLQPPAAGATMTPVATLGYPTEITGDKPKAHKGTFAHNVDYAFTDIHHLLDPHTAINQPHLSGKAYGAMVMCMMSQKGSDEDLFTPAIASGSKPTDPWHINRYATGLHWLTPVKKGG